MRFEYKVVTLKGSLWNGKQRSATAIFKVSSTSLECSDGTSSVSAPTGKMCRPS